MSSWHRRSQSRRGARADRSRATTGGAARRRGRQRTRSTAPAPRFRTRSIRSGSPSTTSCTPTSRINYQPLGSGAGIRQLTSRTVFFGATDQPMKDEQLQSAPGKILHFPTVLGAVVPDLQPAGGVGAAEVHRAAARRHRARQGQEVERSGAREAERRASSCQPPTSPSCIAPRAPGRPSSLLTTWGRSRRSSRARSVSTRRSNGRSGSAARATRASSGLVDADARLARLRRAGLRAAEQDLGRFGAEQHRQPSSPRRSRASRPRQPAPRRTCRPTSACRSPMRPAPTPIPSHPSPGCCSTRIRRTRRRRRSWTTSSAGRSPTARRWRRSWATPACPPRSSTWRLKALEQLKVQ